MLILKTISAVPVIFVLNIGGGRKDNVYIWSLFKSKAIKHSHHREENNVVCFFANWNVMLVSEISALGPRFPVGQENSQPMCCSGNSLFPELFPFALSVGEMTKCIDWDFFYFFWKLMSITLVDSDGFHNCFRYCCWRILRCFREIDFT